VGITPEPVGLEVVTSPEVNVTKGGNSSSMSTVGPLMPVKNTLGATVGDIEISAVD